MRQTAAFLLSVVFVGSTAFKPTLGDAVPQINGNWLIDIRTLCAVGVVVLGGTWWVARWMARVDDRLKSAEARFSVIELTAVQRQEMLVRIQESVDKIVTGDVEH